VRENNRVLGRERIELGIKRKEIEKWESKINDKRIEIDDIKQ
jgi:hypothetical protein